MPTRRHLEAYRLNPGRHQENRRVDNSWFAHTKCFVVDGKDRCSTFYSGSISRSTDKIRDHKNEEGKDFSNANHDV